MQISCHKNKSLSLAKDAEDSVLIKQTEKENLRLLCHNRKKDCGTVISAHASNTLSCGARVAGKNSIPAFYRRVALPFFVINNLYIIYCLCLMKWKKYRQASRTKHFYTYQKGLRTLAY